MARSPADLLTTYLDGLGVGSVGNTNPWRLRTGRQGDSPDQHITLYDSGGTAPNPAYRINYPTIQVRVRGGQDAYGVAYAKTNDIREILLGMEPVDIDGQHFSGVLGTSDIAFLGYDAKSRPEFTVNFRCFLEPSADSSAFMHRQSL